uniref:Frizzled B n=2 Tax=Trichoplax adhaerens TaxID=10228 RepID=A0A0B5CU62_TRIAD|nr:frizzled B [Trichoplax adhaerens]
MSAQIKILKILFTISVVLLWSLCYGEVKCQKVQVKFCQDLNYYNLTTLPDNITQNQLSDEIFQIAHHIIHQNENRCRLARAFLCLSYLPLCYQHYGYQNYEVKPCRELCIKAKSDCDIWNSLPRNPRFNCSLYLQNKKGYICFPPPITTDSKPISTNTVHNAVTLSTKSSTDIVHEASREICDRCKHYSYDSKSQTCRLRCCGEGLFTSKEKKRMNTYMALLSALTFSFTLIAILTAAIRPQRFQYPERILIFMSICYNIYALVHLLRVFLRYETVACGKLDSSNRILTKMTNSSILSHVPCTVIFIMLYYFDLVASIWLVVLTLLWYLSAKKKWCSEIITGYAVYYHTLSWIIPAVPVAVIILWKKVSADELTGLCYISSHLATQKGFYLIGFVILPHSLCLLLASVFMIVFYVSTRKIKAQLAQNTAAKASMVKLSRFRGRVLTFFIFYWLLASIIIGCYCYEYTQGPYWQPLHRNQSRFNQFPCEKRQNIHSDVHISVLAVKLLAQLLRGIVVSFWIASRKTVNEWENIFRLICCSHKFIQF